MSYLYAGILHRDSVSCCFRNSCHGTESGVILGQNTAVHGTTCRLRRMGLVAPVPMLMVSGVVVQEFDRFGEDGRGACAMKEAPF